MAKSKKTRSREHRPIGGSIITVGDRAGLYGQLRVGERRMQKLLVEDAADRDGAELALAAWAFEVQRDTLTREQLDAFSEWLIEVAKTSSKGDECRALARKALGVVETLPTAPGGTRNLSTAAFLGDFLKTVTGRVSEAHAKDIEQRCKSFADFAGDRPMSSIDASVVADYLAKLAASLGHPVKVPVMKDGKPVMKKGKPVERVVRDKLSPHAIRRHRSALSLLWKCAIDRRVAETNVWTGNAAKVARGQDYVPVNLTDDEVARVLALVSEPVRPILTFCAETGLRLNEARSLTWHRVAKGLGSFTVARAKSGRSRTLPTTAKAKEVLQARWDVHVAKTHGEDLVFDDYSRSRIYVVFKNAVKKAGVDRRTRVHDLRHHVGSALANANVPIHTVMAALGHSRLVTVQRYLHHGADALADAFRAVEAARAPAAAPAVAATSA